MHKVKFKLNYALVSLEVQHCNCRQLLGHTTIEATVSQKEIL
jgi:hypothetical protein